MTTIGKIESELISSIIKLSTLDQLMNIIHIDSSNTKVYNIESKLESGSIKSVTKNIKLKRHKTILKTLPNDIMIITDEINSKTINGDKNVYECLSERLVRDFIYLLELKRSNESINIFKNIVRKIFKRRKANLVNDIFEMGLNSNWIILSHSSYLTIRKSNLFNYNNKRKSNNIIRNVGKLKLDSLCIDVYVSDEISNDIIYFGSYDSSYLFLNRDLVLSEMNNTTMSIEFDYELVINDIKFIYV